MSTFCSQDLKFPVKLDASYTAVKCFRSASAFMFSPYFISYFPVWFFYGTCTYIDVWVALAFLSLGPEKLNTVVN